MHILLQVFLFVKQFALGELVIEGFEFAGLDPAAFPLQQGGQVDFFFGFFFVVAVCLAHFGVECLFALLKGFLVELAVLLGLFELEGGDADFENCVGCVWWGVRFFLEAGRMCGSCVLKLYKLQNKVQL